MDRLVTAYRALLQKAAAASVPDPERRFQARVDVPTLNSAVDYLFIQSGNWLASLRETYTSNASALVSADREAARMESELGALRALVDTAPRHLSLIEARRKVRAREISSQTALFDDLRSKAMAMHNRESEAASAIWNLMNGFYHPDSTAGLGVTISTRKQPHERLMSITNEVFIPPKAAEASFTITAASAPAPLIPTGTLEQKLSNAEFWIDYARVMVPATSALGTELRIQEAADRTLRVEYARLKRSAHWLSERMERADAMLDHDDEILKSLDFNQRQISREAARTVAQAAAFIALKEQVVIPAVKKVLAANGLSLRVEQYEQLETAKRSLSALFPGVRNWKHMDALLDAEREVVGVIRDIEGFMPRALESGAFDSSAQMASLASAFWKTSTVPRSAEIMEKAAAAEPGPAGQVLKKLMLLSAR